MNSGLSVAESNKFRRAGIIERAGNVGRRLFTGTRVRPVLKRTYHALLNLQTGGRGLECRLPDGESVRISPAFRYVSWNQDEYRAFKAAAGPGKVAFDIGANVGCYSMLFGQWVGGAGKVFAFEPSPATFAGLQQHVTLNQLGQVVRTVQAAVSDSSATADFLVLDNHGTSRLASGGKSADAGRIVRVPTVSVDEFCEREGVIPDLIKIDVEGFELSVLRGARETIKARRENLALFVEMHPSTWCELGLTRDEIVDELKRQDLKAVPLRDCANMWNLEGECLRIVPA